MNDAPRAATIQVCEEGTHFAVLDKQYYDEILKSVNNSQVFLEKFGAMKIFKSWSYFLVKMCYDLATEVDFQIGNYIYQEGDTAKFIYFIKDGECEVRKQLTFVNPDHNKEINSQQYPLLVGKKKYSDQVKKLCTLGILSGGECFGEEEIFGRERTAKEPKRDYSVICRTQTMTVYQINKADIIKMAYMYQDIVLTSFKQQIEIKQDFRLSYIQKLQEEK